MDPFFAGNACPDCGEIGAGFSHHAGRCDVFNDVQEHIHRHCGYCGHEWPEEARELARRHEAAEAAHLPPQRASAIVVRLIGRTRVRRA